MDSAVLISAGPDAVICNGDSLQLNVHLLHAAIPYCIPTYAVSSIPYAAITPTGTTSAGPAGDDIVSSATAMPR